MTIHVARRLIETEDHVKTLIKDWLADYCAGNWSYGPIQNGLGEHGIHDRIACVPVVVTQAMVGKRLGVFVSIEAKRPGRRGEKRRGMSTHQFNHMNAIIEAGGISLCCDGGEDLQFFNQCMEQLQHG